MPYIALQNRPQYEALIQELTAKLTVDKPGDINYVFSTIISRLAKRNITYKNLNALKGVLDEVKDEFRVRIIRPYEDEKKAQNGDIL